MFPGSSAQFPAYLSNFSNQWNPHMPTQMPMQNCPPQYAQPQPWKQGWRGQIYSNNLPQPVPASAYPNYNSYARQLHINYYLGFASPPSLPPIPPELQFPSNQNTP